MALGMQSLDSSVSPSVSGTPRRGRFVTPAAQRRKSRSRSRGRSASRRIIQEELTWADRVKEKSPKPKKVTQSASPEHDEKSEIEQLHPEIASLKAELRKHKAAQAVSSRVEGADVADNAVNKSTQEPKVEVNKAKRKALPPKDESDSEMQVESSQNKMLEDLLRISKENQLSINQLALSMGAFESKVGAIENKVVALENKMAIKTRPKNAAENRESTVFVNAAQHGKSSAFALAFIDGNGELRSSASVRLATSAVAEQVAIALAMTGRSPTTVLTR
ncbi:hypothetical protein HPB51_027304 [Rhipicephalus microplus]|uniref:Uncharacterized protein n=1 Tax=Rhipicephalus microplus TaxID=6941 RepID=A0A9J6D0K6_RHIMP|nr:hypothetical protein HPB51_027304 [Rhipicephalus microplus]